MIKLREIREHISRGEISEAIKVLNLEIKDSVFEREVELITSSFVDIEEKNIRGIVSEAEYRMGINEISESILRLLEQIELKLESDGVDSLNRVNNKNRIVILIIAIIFIAVVGCLSYNWYKTKDILICKDYISFLTIGVDEFEKKLSKIPLSKTGKFTVLEGKYHLRTFLFREYSIGSSIGNSSYFCWKLFPQRDIFLFETNNSESHQRTKNLFKNCGFVFKSTTDTGYDIYQKDNINIYIYTRETNTPLRSSIYVIRLEK